MTTDQISGPSSRIKLLSSGKQGKHHSSWHVPALMTRDTVSQQKTISKPQML